MEFRHGVRRQGLHAGQPARRKPTTGTLRGARHRLGGRTLVRGPRRGVLSGWRHGKHRRAKVNTHRRGRPGLRADVVPQAVLLESRHRCRRLEPRLPGRVPRHVGDSLAECRLAARGGGPGVPELQRRQPVPDGSPSQRRQDPMERPERRHDPLLAGAGNLGRDSTSGVRDFPGDARSVARNRRRSVAPFLCSVLHVDRRQPGGGERYCLCLLRLRPWGLDGEGYPQRIGLHGHPDRLQTQQRPPEPLGLPGPPRRSPLQHCRALDAQPRLLQSRRPDQHLD